MSALLWCACCVGVSPLDAQPVRQIPVIIHVLDSAGHAVENASVSLLRGLSNTLSTGLTGQNGVHVAVLSVMTGEVQVTVRHVGYRPVQRVIALGGDTARVEMVLHRLATRLDTVRVTAEETARRQRTYIDADAIAESTRPLVNAIDVIEKLRPEMTREPPDFTGSCQAVQNVWVNGQRVEWRLPGSGKTVIISPELAMRVASGARIGPALQSAGEGPIAILASIHVEHIASIAYHDCTQTSVEKLGGTSALFITLKEGVAFEPGRGSFVMESSATDSLRQRLFRRSALSFAPTSGMSAPVARVVGVFDQQSGAPIPDAVVTEVGTGLSVRTSETGSLTLGFMEGRSGRLSIRARGFRPDSLDVTVSPGDTLPITILLIRTDSLQPRY